MFLEINNLKKSFGTGESRVEVLKGIQFSVEKGEICVLFGPSGSGKSTLLNIIGGIDEADSGSIVIEGEKIEDMNEKTRLLTETNKTLIDDTNTLSSTSEEISASSEETCAMCSDNAERFKTVNNVIAELTADAGKMNVFIEEYDRMHASDTEEIHETVERTA